MVSLNASATPQISRDVRAILFISSVVGVIFNIAMAAVGKKKVEGALGVVFVSLLNFSTLLPESLEPGQVNWQKNQLGLSAIVSSFQLAKPHSKPVLNVFLDAFFTIALFLLYILVLVLSSVLRRHIFGVYANMLCLVSRLVLSPIKWKRHPKLTANHSALHGYAFVKVTYHLVQKRFGSGAAFCPHCSVRPADYKSVPSAQEPRGDRDSDPLADDDERTPLYRDSEDTAVMEV